MPDSKTILYWIRDIIEASADAGYKLTLTSVIKYLYLADLYVARETGGTPFTNWNWVFLHYGPFAREASDAVKSAVEQGLISIDTYSKYSEDDCSLFSLPFDRKRLPPSSLSGIPIAALSSVRRAVKEFGGDLPRLLNYVYTETEPMLHAVPGASLQFKSARKPTVEKEMTLKNLNKNQLEAGRALLKSLAQRKSQPSTAQPIYDSILEESVKQMDEADAERLSATGVADISSLIGRHGR